MAKKTSPGRGQKLCPSCQQVVAARASSCPNCGHRFAKKKKSTKKRGRRAASVEAAGLSNDQIATVLGAQELIQKCGGARAAIDLIKTVSETR